MFISRNKTEDPSVPYAGQGHVTQRRVSHNYCEIVQLTQENPKEPQIILGDPREP